MPYIPHTQADIAALLQSIGMTDLDELFREIPPHLRMSELPGIPPGLNEMAMTRLMQTRADGNQAGQCYLGAGAYEHFIPAVVWAIASRGEFLTAYTPYQAEASQGNLQLIYEFQTMIASLLGMEVANASLYDGASAMAEAVLMAIRCQKSKSRRVLVAGTIHPRYRETLDTIVKQQGIECEVWPFDPALGRLDAKYTTTLASKAYAAVVIAQPNFLGQLETVDAITDWAHQRGAMVVACVNPIAMAVLKEPGKWGKLGADIVCGEGQPLGIPLASGGPYFGFLASRLTFVRQIPGRIVGRTIDAEGNPGFTLTLQAREQHIRRSKATSNICTNQGLLVTAATIYMALMGASGLGEVATLSHQRCGELAQHLALIEGVEVVYQTPFFHELVCRFSQPIDAVITAMAQRGIYAGYPLSEDYPELGNSLLVCVTETKTAEDIQQYAKTLQAVLRGHP